MKMSKHLFARLAFAVTFLAATLTATSAHAGCWLPDGGHDCNCIFKVCYRGCLNDGWGVPPAPDCVHSCEAEEEYCFILG